MRPPRLILHQKPGPAMNNNEYFSSISDVSAQLNVPAHTLRYWEKQFPVAIRPTTGAGGRRYYRAETVEKLTVIRDLLYTQGMTIAGVKKLLRDGNFPQAATAVNLSPVAPASAPAAGAAKNSDRVAGAEIDRAIDLLTQAAALLNG